MVLRIRVDPFLYAKFFSFRARRLLILILQANILPPYQLL